MWHTSNVLIKFVVDHLNRSFINKIWFRYQFKKFADQTSDPYASIGLIVLSNTFNGKLAISVTVKPVYKELHKENIPLIALSHNTLTASLRLPFLVVIRNGN